jgi:hypothetical protein
MGKRERRAYLDAIRGRYRRAKKAGKTAILNEFCAVCGYHRKYALRLLAAPFRRKKKSPQKPGPSSRYDTPALVEALRTIWLASDQLCSKRLKAALPLWLPHYETRFTPLSTETASALNSISAATIDRLLKPIRAKAGRRSFLAPSLEPYSRNRFRFRLACGISLRPASWKPIPSPIVAIAWRVISCGS